MKLDVTFRNLRARDEVRRRAQALFDKLERFLDPSAHGVLVIQVEHGATQVELTVTAAHHVHVAHDEDADLRTSLDRTFHKMETTLRRHKERRLAQRGRAEKLEGFTSEAADAIDGLEGTV